MHEGGSTFQESEICILPLARVPNRVKAYTKPKLRKIGSDGADAMQTEGRSGNK